MSEYLQENRRAVIMLVVALCVALLGGMYLLLSGGGGEDATSTPVPKGQTPTPATVEVAEDTTTAAVTTVVGRGSNADPFGPLVGTEEDAADPGGSGSGSTGTKNGSPGSKNTSSSSSSDPAMTVDSGKSSSGTPVDVSGSSSGDEQKPSSDEPKSVVPEPITKGGDAEDAVPVTVIDITADYVVARVGGDRTRLYISIPGVQAVTYMAPLGGDCAWLGRGESDVRVSVCRGKTERL